MATKTAATFTTEMVAVDSLKPHPKNYRQHPDDELEHIAESIKVHGFYRNIVIAKDGTILAGHGVVQAAAQKLGYEQVPARRMPYGPNDARAKKLLVADNEIGHLSDIDDRRLTELLKELKVSDEGLLGTGYDEMMLANLLFVTRTSDEIQDLQAAAQWVGMPEYDLGQGRIQIIVNFATEEDRGKFCQVLGIEVSSLRGSGLGKSIWWPTRREDDNRSVLFTNREEASIHHG